MFDLLNQAATWMEARAVAIGMASVLVFAITETTRDLRGGRNNNYKEKHNEAP